MGLAMDLDGRLGRWRFDEAEDLAGGLVVPVTLIGHAVGRSDFDVAGVRVGDGGRGQTGIWSWVSRYVGIRRIS